MRLLGSSVWGFTGLVTATSLAACAGGAPPPPATSTTRNAPSPGATATSPPDAAALAAADAAVSPSPIDPGRPIETTCNGQDDDGDGLVDVLLPLGQNLCNTGQRGACAAGVALCEKGARVCLAPPPMPEVLDGLDNDCNGTVDDVPEAAVHPRAVMLVPKYAWSDAAPDVANVATSLAQAGIPFERPAKGSDWGALGALDDAQLAIVPGYLLGSVLPPVRDKIEAFVQRGGVLVVFKPIGETGSPEALTLAGLRTGTRHRDVEELRFDGALSPATRLLDSPEERSLGVNGKGEKDGLEVWTFDPDPQAKTEVLGTAYRAGTALGAAVTRRRLGKGSVYAIGHDLAAFGGPRCYLGCFEPAGDVLRLVLEGALREGSQGHVALLSTTRAPASSVLVLTHDLTTHESQSAGDWGEPGAIQFAKVEKERGVRATFNVMTDYKNGDFNTKTVRALCDLGMCPVGIEGVAPVAQFTRMGDGMVRSSPTAPWVCKETLPTYKTPSLCGEVFLSYQLARSATGQAPRSWRSPHLAYHAELIQILANGGIPYDSSFGIGDLPYSVPLDLASTGIQQRRFHRRAVLEFALAGDDALDLGDDQRVELQPETEARFRSLWEYLVLENQRNGSMTTLRVSPSRGEGASADNVHAKALFFGRFLDEVARLGRGQIAVEPIADVGDYWRARLDATLDARFDAKGYTGSLTLGKATTAGLTLEFGDAIASFDCPKCGATKVDGKRVAIEGALPAGTKVDFVAKLR
ncbi:MAG TPA: hypothetical protein VGI39_35200 [Polyangiaceae bacterium]